MATYVKGNAVANATSYELNEKNGDGTYTPLETKNEINFELDALGLAAGNHTMVVKAKADGYEDSDYSNEVVYTVEGLPSIEDVPEEVLCANLAYSINANNGELQQTTATLTFKVVSDYVEIPEGSHISEYYAIADTSQGSNPGPNAYCAFYDANKTFISSVQPTGTEALEWGTWKGTKTPPTIPAGAKYIRVAFNSTNGEQSGATLKFAR